MFPVESDGLGAFEQSTVLLVVIKQKSLSILASLADVMLGVEVLRIVVA
jgi:hypothetical protein